MNETLKLFIHSFLDRHYRIGEYEEVDSRHWPVIKSTISETYFGLFVGDGLKEELNEIFDLGESIEPIIIEWLTSQGIKPGEDYFTPDILEI